MDSKKEHIRRLDAFEVWIWRRMMKVLWTEQKTNEKILQIRYDSGYLTVRYSATRPLHKIGLPACD